jgi:hypothetical protein
MKTIKAITGLLEKLGAIIEDNKRNYKSQMTHNTEGLDAHARSLK